ncbi:ATP synthase F1 subunit delta [Mycoplasmopsis primatum]|uniref:ATP synthase F1 subunit delta n=1 Tax=Mycoplasmopsis primatum TaxID=55604 RepID=UPI000496628F|nr:ATP synthase F1 subunit delta [Mycoplasmopsis primatum]
MYVKANADGYALALYDLHKEEKKISSTYEFIVAFYDSIVQDKNIINFLANAKIPKQEKYNVVELWAKNDSTLKTFITFLKVIIDKNASNILLRILSIYISRVEKDLNILRVKFISALPIAQNTLAKIIKKLELQYSKKVILKIFIDKSLISGFRIEINNEVIEQNIKNDLDKISRLIINEKGGLND